MAKLSATFTGLSWLIGQTEEVIVDNNHRVRLLGVDRVVLAVIESPHLVRLINAARKEMVTSEG